MKKLSALLVVAVALPIAGPAVAKTQSGTVGNLSYIASNKVIGQTSTATIVGGGDPIYLAQSSQYRGVVGLDLDYGSLGGFVCSGSLSADRMSIITAAHCVNIGGKRPDKVTVDFYDGNPADPQFYAPGAPGITGVGVNKIFVNPLYTGEVIDDHDIAVLRLAGPAPSYAPGYSLYSGSDLTGLTYNIAGYGVRSDVGGAIGADLAPGRLRQGLNRYDFRLGDPDFQGFFAGGPNGFFGTAETDYSYLGDFDNGTVGVDASCGLALALGIAPSGKYCNLGTGAREVSTGGGDSGGPQFVNGQLASVTSYGLTFGLSVQPGDIDDLLNDTWGEFNGFVPVYNNLDFINYALSAVPEPGTWALMIGGIGVLGAALRRRKVGVAYA